MDLFFGKYNRQSWHTRRSDSAVVEIDKAAIKEMREKWNAGDDLVICPMWTPAGLILRHGYVNGRGYQLRPASRNNGRLRITFERRQFPWLSSIEHCELSLLKGEFTQGNDILVKIPSGLPAPSYRRRFTKAPPIRSSKATDLPAPTTPRRRGGGVVLLELEGVQCSFVNVPIDIRLQVANLLTQYQEIQG